MPEISDEEFKKLTDASKERDTLKEELEKSKSKKEEDDKEKNKKIDDDKSKDKSKKEDDDLLDRVKRENQSKDQSRDELKKIEKALGFNLAVSKFVDDNKDILPSQVPDILKAAEKEKYDTAFEKASAVRTAIIKTFFELQANVDLLTATQKNTLEDYLKLTKGGREEKSEMIYENLFEPTFEMAKRLKKADELGKVRNGFSSGSKLEDDYKERLMKTSAKTYLGEKGEK